MADFEFDPKVCDNCPLWSSTFQLCLADGVDDCPQFYVSEVEVNA